MTINDCLWYSIFLKMNPLIIQPTEHTPKVIFDIEKLQKGKHIFEISGESRPEDAKIFYEPILKWLEDFKKYLRALDNAGDNRMRKIRLIFKMIYFNSSSAKYLFDIIQKMEEIIKQCHNANIKILWLYNSKDEDIFDTGEEFRGMTSIPFDLEVLKPGEAI